MKLRFNKKLVAGIAAGLAVAAGVIAGNIGTSQAQAQTTATVRDNSNNSIIRGGTVTQQEFADKARANNPADLQAIFTAYGLTPAEYDRFQQNAKMGVAHKNGDIIVDGKVVARNAYSLGREQKSYSTAKSIGGTRYYESRSQDVFVPETIPAMVLFNDQGQFEFAVLTACGNPVRATPVTQPRPVTPVGTAPTPVTPVTPQPAYQTPEHRCTSLQAVRRAGTTGTTPSLQYTFTANTSHRNARVSYADFNFGDGTVQNSVTPQMNTVGSTTTTSGTTTNGTTGTTSTTNTNTNTLGTSRVSVDHTYAQAGNYTAQATVYFTVTDANGATSNASETCQVQVNIAQPVTPAATTPTVPAATTLPATGVGTFAVIFLAVSTLGSAGYYLYTKRRLALYQ